MSGEFVDEALILCSGPISTPHNIMQQLSTNHNILAHPVDKCIDPLLDLTSHDLTYLILTFLSENRFMAIRPRRPRLCHSVYAHKTLHLTLRNRTVSIIETAEPLAARC